MLNLKKSMLFSSFLWVILDRIKLMKTLPDCYHTNFLSEIEISE